MPVSIYLENSQVNHIHEWNPGKIGWMKSGGKSTENNVSWVVEVEVLRTCFPIGCPLYLCFMFIKKNQILEIHRSNDSVPIKL